MSIMDIDLEGFVRHLMEAERHLEKDTEDALTKAAKLVQHQARELLGTYEAGWPELAQPTQDQRAKLGFPPNEPLERTHELGEHILYHIELHSAHSGEAAIGVPSVTVGNGSQANPIRDIGDVAVWQEMGTDHIPARSFLGMAALLKEREIKEILGESATAALVGKR